MKRLLCSMLTSLALVLPGCDAQQPLTAPNTLAPQNTAAASQQQSDALPAPPKDAVASLARNFYFVLDGSGSMRDACSGRQSRKIDQAKEAVAAFMAVVPTNANLGLIVFDARGSREVLPLGSNNRQLFLQAVAAIEADGGTPLNGSIIFGINRLVEQRAKQLNYGEFRMIVVTDGEASDGPISKCGEHSRKTGIPIYTIGLCMSGGHALMNYSITYRDASNKAQLKAALEETVAESDTAEK